MTLVVVVVGEGGGVVVMTFLNANIVVNIDNEF